MGRPGWWAFRKPVKFLGLTKGKKSLHIRANDGTTSCRFSFEPHNLKLNMVCERLHKYVLSALISPDLSTIDSPRNESHHR
jgi:hypothetical protein